MAALALACVAAAAHAQQFGRIVGTVTGAADGRPLGAATVSVQGTGLSILTDSLGTFAIDHVPAGSQQVRAARRGYADEALTVVVAANASDTLNFQLTAEAPAESAAAGPGEEAWRDLTGSVARVEPADLRDVPLPGPAQLLQARAEGVDVVSTEYRPGAPMEVTVRGTRSFAGSSQPLYVVDGVPLVEGGIEDFNAAQIASVEVLKDAEAAAPYGARGANGVVLMTTRRGAADTDAAASGFTYDVQYGAQTALRQVPLMNGPEAARERLDAYRLAGRNTALDSVFSPDELPQVYCGLNVPTTPAGRYDTTASGTSTYRATHRGCSTGTDWQRLLLHTGTQQRHRLGYDAAWGHARLAVSGLYFSQSGVTLGQGFHQYLGDVSFEDALGPLRLGLTALGGRSIADIGGDWQLWNEAVENNPLGLPYDSAGTPYPTPCAVCTLKIHPTPDPLRVNPLVEQQGYVHQQKTDRLVGSLFAELRLPASLAYRITFGPDAQHVADGELQDANVVLGSAPIGSPQAGLAVHRAYRWTLDNQVTWSPLTGRHALDVTALYTMTRSRFESDSASSKTLPYDYQLWQNPGTAPTPAVSMWSAARTHAWMGRVAYTYLGRYSVTLTGRQDCSTAVLGRDCGGTGAAGAAWLLGDEPFMRIVPFLSGLTLRASYGSSRTASLDAFEGNILTAAPNVWLTTRQLDVGLDVGLFGDRVNGTFDVYRQDTDDPLVSPSPPSPWGPPPATDALARNTGWELSVGTVNLKGDGGGLRWTTELSLSHNDNRITGLPYGSDWVADGWFVGQPVNVAGDPLHQVFYDLRMIGIWQLADSLLARQYGQKPGDIRVADLNGDGKIDGFDRQVVGNTYPRLIASVHSRITWGAFDLSFLLEGRIGYTFLDGFRVNTDLFDRDNNLNVPYWTPERCDGGPDPTELDPPAGVTGAQQAAIPGCNAWWSPSAGRQQPPYDQDGNGAPYAAPGYRVGTHWRVRNITLGYALPRSLVRLVQRVRSMRVYVEAQDPWVFTSYEGYDPENGNSGGPPSYRTLLVGLSLGFD